MCRYPDLQTVRISGVEFCGRLTEDFESIAFLCLDPVVADKGVEVEEVWAIQLVGSQYFGLSRRKRGTNLEGQPVLLDHGDGDDDDDDG